MTKDASTLTVDDLMANPIWEFLETDDDETGVRAVSPPVGDLAGRIAGTKVRLANNQESWAVLGNVDLHDLKSTLHFLTISIERNGKWFHLARYHDADRARRGPEALAEFLDLPESEVFPISYDIRSLVTGDPLGAVGQIDREPDQKLSEDELLDLAIGY